MTHNPDARGARQHRQKPARTNRMTLVKKMLRAADNAAKEREGAKEKLYSLVVYCLENGNEPDLRQALAQADSKEIYEGLESIVHLAAGSAFNIMVLETGERLNVELFAIPFLFALRGDQYQEVPQVLEDEDLDWLTKSFRLHGLKEADNQTVMMSPELWSAQEIYNWPFHKVFKLANAFGEAIGNRMPIDAEYILDTSVEPSPVSDDALMLCLRYAVGAFVHSSDSLIPFQEEVNEEKLETWIEAVEERLSKQYGGPVEVFDPDSLYDALEDGWFQYHAFTAALERSRMFEDARILPAEVAAVISLHGTEEKLAQIRVGYSRIGDDGEFELIGGSVWPLAPFDDPSDIADFLKYSMEDSGIARIEIVAELQEEQYDEDSGEPAFLQPTQTRIPGKPPLFPASRHLH